jgi:hypothetical protein
MKKTIYILTLTLIANIAFAQNFENLKQQNGKFVNNGTFRVLKPSNVNGLPDTLGGKVEFIADVENTRQTVPNIVYNKLVFKGKTIKEVQEDPLYPANNPLVTKDTFLVENDEFVLVTKYDVHAKGYTHNISEIRGDEEIILNREQSSQELSGDGRFSRLAIDNIFGVDVVNGGGFTVTENLRLQRGQLRNSEENNFVIADSVDIQRTTSASLAYAPQFEGTVDIEYTGTGNLTTGPEVPDEKTSLRTLVVKNSDSLKLGGNVFVNDSLYVGTHIHTQARGDSIASDTLSLPADKDPVFRRVTPDSSLAEIHGAFARPGIIANDTIVLNNPYTFVYFDSEENKNNIYRITSVVYPQRFPNFPDTDDKVARSFEITATDISNNSVTDGFDMAFGYGWRNAVDIPQIDETFGMNLPELILQRWDEDRNEWEELASEENFTNGIWAYSQSLSLSQTGNYAIGMPLMDYFVFKAKIMLQGAYNKNTGEMDQDLYAAGYLNKPPVNEYPFNLTNFNYTGIGDVPDSAVDWVMLEFREGPFEPAKFYKPAFVDRYGQIIDTAGVFGVTISERDGIAEGNSANLNVVIRHRNHMPVMTRNLRFDTSNSKIVYDFTRFSDISTYLLETPEQLMRMDFDETEGYLYTLTGGYIYGIDSENMMTSEITEDKDYFYTILNNWNKSDFDGYKYYDFDMNGTISTRDFNLRWNNRTKTNNVTEIQ